MCTNSVVRMDPKWSAQCHVMFWLQASADLHQNVCRNYYSAVLGVESGLTLLLITRTLDENEKGKQLVNLQDGSLLNRNH